MPQALDNYVGQRLSFHSSCCSVRYVGTVLGTSGTWLGVEWDDPNVGKHSGTHNNIQYFKCMLVFSDESPTYISTGKSSSHLAASFIRPHRPSDTPVSFLQALRDKYQDSTIRERSDVVVVSGKVVEEVGFDKIKTAQAMLSSLEVVLLDDRRIAGAQIGPWTPSVSPSELDEVSTEIGTTCPRIRQLDLSYNLVESLLDVAVVCRRLFNLRTLTLNGNRFKSVSIQNPLFEPFHSAFRHIIELHLNETLLSWDEIIELISLFPNLKTISLAANHIRTLHKPIPCLLVESINLAQNNISSIESLECLSNLPHLKSLSLRDNSIDTLNSRKAFCNLVSLDISANNLPTLASLDLIRTSFPSVSSLRVADNPFYTELSIDDAHMLSIARVPRVSVLNFSEVSSEKRDDSELYYLSQIAAELEASDETQSAEVLKRHPLWESLCQKHRIPAVYRARSGDAKQGTLRTRLVRLELKTAGTPNDSPVPFICVPKSINVYMLKSIIGERLGLLPGRFRVIWETSEWDPAGVEKFDKEDDGRFELHSLSLGGSVHVEGSWIQREIDIFTRTSSLGFWIDDSEATLRIEKII